MAQLNFDASQHNASQTRDALPKGWYQGHIISSEIGQTSKGGQKLDFVVEIDAPPFAKGRKVFPSYNIVNDNEDTVRIAYEQLAALSIAAGMPRWQQTEQLHNLPFQIKLAIEKAAEGTDYDDRNKPVGYDSMSIHRALATQPLATGAAPMGAAFPGTSSPAPSAQFNAPVIPGAGQPAQVTQQAPVQQAAPATAQPWAGAQQPWQTATAPVQQAAPVQHQAPTQQQAAPIQQVAQVEQAPIKSPEQIAWETQQAQQLAQQQAAPVNPAPVQQAAAPVEGAAPAPWQTQTAQPTPQVAANPQAAPAAAEAPHPAQAQLPPWQQAPAQ